MQNKFYNINQYKEDDESPQSISPDKNKKNEDSFFIDNEEENKWHDNQGQIGDGSTSIAYKVVDIRTNTPMCKKVLKYNKGQIKIKDAKNALKEFELLHNLSHPCICKAIGINISEKAEIINDDGEKIVLFLEFLEYKLDEVLEMKIRNTLKARIALDIAHAMKFIHKCGMMHRDLKIDNIMLNAFMETKLINFGLAKINESVIDGFSFEQETLTKCIGSFEYMSPEMAKEDEYDNKTDVYSFGVVLYVIFAGCLPKLSQKQKIEGKNPKLSNPSESISFFCINLIQRCLSYNPKDRPTFETILNLMRNNLYKLADGVDSSILSKRDKELELFENNK